MIFIVWTKKKKKGIFQNIIFYVPKKKEMHSFLEQHEGEQNIFEWTIPLRNK